MQEHDEPDPSDRIRKRAYEIWENEGRPDGRAKDHWAQAESEGGGMAEERSPYGAEEQPGAGQAEPGTDVPEATAQPGEAAPASGGDSGASSGSGAEDGPAPAPKKRAVRGSRPKT